MNKKVWVCKEEDFKKSLKNTKVSNVHNKFRWTEAEEKYLLEFLPKVGVKVVSKSLRRSPVAIRAKFLRLTGIIDKKGRMRVSLKEGSTIPGTIKSEYVTVARESLKEINRPNKANFQKKDVVLLPEKIEKTNSSLNNFEKDNGLNKLLIISIVMSGMSLLLAILILKIII